MKKGSFSIALAAAALCGLLLVSCSKETTFLDGGPSLTLTTVSEIPADGGSYTFTYTIHNAASDGSLAFTSDVSWITNIIGSDSGAVTFTVAENTGEDIRTGNVSVSYSYGSGSSLKYVIEKASVIQYGTGTPLFTLESTVVTAGDEAGDYTFSYTLENEAFDGEVSCFTTDDDWIIGFDCSTSGKVTYSLTANEGETVRTGTINLIYTYRYGHQITKDITVVQYYPGYGGDVTDVIGSYEATAYVYDFDGDFTKVPTWSLNIYPYEGDKGYDIVVDGIAPYCENGYATYGDYRMCAFGYVQDGTIVIPSQCSTTTTIESNSNTYYLGFTPCTGWDGGTSFYYDGAYYPSLTFYPESDGQWDSGSYGLLVIGCGDPGLLHIRTTFEVLYSVIYLRKI